MAAAMTAVTTVTRTIQNAVSLALTYQSPLFICLSHFPAVRKFREAEEEAEEALENFGVCLSLLHYYTNIIILCCVSKVIQS